MKWRKMTWALIAWSALMLVWIVAGANSADCGSQGDKYSQAGCETGAGIAVFGVIVIWFLGFVVLALIWFMTRPKERPVAPPQVQPQVQPGWYPEPGNHGSLRYWDGFQWTEHRQPVA